LGGDTLPSIYNMLLDLSHTNESSPLSAVTIGQASSVQQDDIAA